MRWFGLTGGIATGKSTAAKILRELGVPVVDADELARLVVRPGSPGLKQVVAAFGASVLQADQSLDRSKLGKLIFNDPQKRAQLEGILHPLIQDLRGDERRRLESEGVAFAFYDVPLLFEKNLQDEFDQVILVYAPKALQADRLRTRDGISSAEIEQRLNAQMDIEQKRHLANAVWENVGSMADLKKQINRYLETL